MLESYHYLPLLDSTPVVRAASLEARMSHYLVRRIEVTPDIDVRTGPRSSTAAAAPRAARARERRRGAGQRPRPPENCCPRTRRRRPTVAGARSARSDDRALRGRAAGPPRAPGWLAHHWPRVRTR